MSIRIKKIKKLSCLQILESRREGQKVKQHVLATPGPALVFEILWKELGLRELIEECHAGARHRFSLGRAILLTGPHRLFGSGSDRSTESGKEDYLIEGAKELELQHLDGAMGLPGEELPSQERPAEGLPPGCRKDLLKERLLERNRDLCGAMAPVFFDTSLRYFEGEGGESLGSNDHSKDHRSDERRVNEDARDQHGPFGVRGGAAAYAVADGGDDLSLEKERGRNPPPLSQLRFTRDAIPPLA